MSMAAESVIDLLVSRRTGVITEIGHQHRGAEEPVPPHLFTATLAHFDFRTAPLSERLSGGKGATEGAAKLSAIGEAVERYSAYHWDAGRTWTGLAGPGAITPADCVLYSDAQYEAGMRYQRWTPETEISWIHGVELPSGAPVALPAGLVYLVNPLPLAADHVTATTSNGLAAGPDLTRAILSGFYEVIERDALMIGWMNQLPATRIDVAQTGCHAASIARHYRRHGVELRLYRLATDQAAYVMLAVLDDIGSEGQGSEGPVRVTGMGCDVDPVTAADKAVFEACQARPSEATRFARAHPGERLKRYEDVKDLDDHPAFHSLRRNLAEFAFLDTGGRAELGSLPRPATPDPAATLDLVVDGLVRAGARAAYADITGADIAVTGIRVVRCIATGFQPIHFGHGEARLGGRRLFEAPVAWGLRDAARGAAELNPCPHPMA